VALFLRYGLFRSVTEQDVFAALGSFYRQRHATADVEVHCQHNEWTVAVFDAGWRLWPEHRDALRFVSRALSCPAFLVFVYDGDYWGYEFVDHGDSIDYFVQRREPDWDAFPGENYRGNAQRIAERLPFLEIGDIAPYLVQADDLGSDVDPLNVPARAGDEFARFDECAVVDFLRMLGVQVKLRSGRITPPAPVFRGGGRMRR
jgi:hypothetical protein